jgi:serine/threonine protein phosphatase 1
MRYVIGDIHGKYDALIECLTLCNFNYEEDELICLGDVPDRGDKVVECFDELLKIKNLIYILGNHDAWLLNWFNTGDENLAWLQNGGDTTLESYNYSPNIEHKKLLDKAVYYHIDDNNNLYVHGGYDKSYDIDKQSSWNYRHIWGGNMHHEYNWNREYWNLAQIWKEYGHDKTKIFDTNFNKVFIGHTPTNYNNSDTKPVKASNVWNLDQGAAYGKLLTIMNVDTEEYWQSKLTK